MDAFEAPFRALGRKVLRERGTALALACTIAIALGGCAKTVVSEDLAGFGKAANAIGQQADLTFVQSNKLIRDVSIDRFVRSRAPGLAESQFQVAVTRAEIDAWTESLTALGDYGAGLASLVDSRRGAQTSDALILLGQKLNNGVVGTNINPGIASAFASLGGALVDARAQGEARRILQKTDPSIQTLLGEMASAIGDSDAQGLRGTVLTNWNTSFNGVRSAYGSAAEKGDEAAQRRLVAEYLAGLDRRDAQLRSLANLRASLVNLGAAHAAAAKGAPATVDGLLAQVERRLDETKRLYQAFEKDQDKKGDK